MNKFVIFLSCLVLVYLIAGIGSYFTASETSGEWYLSIKPALTPPNWVFPVVWNILFFLIATSLALAWINSKNKEDKKEVAWLFGINLVLNLLWSFLFFGIRNPMLGFIEIIILCISILVLMIKTYKISKTASWLLLPYFLWVSFAIILTYLAMINNLKLAY